MNHSVGEETEYDASESGPTSKEDAKTIINRPPFDVEINRGGRILGFRCSMVAPPPKESTSPDDPYSKDTFLSWPELTYYFCEI